MSPGLSWSPYVGLKSDLPWTWSKLNICLTHNDQLVAVSTWIFDKKKKILTLDRYATTCIVVGGFSKLLKQGIQLARDLGATKIVTYSDHEISNGDLYSKTGFINDGIIKPSYYYIQNNGRVHKSNFRKSPSTTKKIFVIYAT